MKDYGRTLTDEELRKALTIMNDEDLIKVCEQTKMDVIFERRILEDRAGVIGRLMGDDCEACKDPVENMPKVIQYHKKLKQKR